MNSLEPELRVLHAEGVLDDATAAVAIARERRATFSVYPELRVATWGAVSAIATGVGLLLAKNLERIGPTAIAAGVAVLAATCYAAAARARRHGPLGIVPEYVLLLGTLLVSADLGFVERSFNLLGAGWTWHLLLLALVHGVTAYAFGSTLVLAASLAALAGWFGVGPPAGSVFGLAPPGSLPAAAAFECALVVATWRAVDRRRAATAFTNTFDHFIANLAGAASLGWCLDRPLAGVTLLAVVAAGSVLHGRRTRRDAFVVYGVGYAAVGLCIVVIKDSHADAAALVGFVLLVVAAAAAALHLLRSRDSGEPQ